MLENLPRSERLLLLKFLCAFAWTDLKVVDKEKRFIERVMRQLSLEPDERVQVETWLSVAPSPGSVTFDKVPPEHRRIFIEAVRALIYSDGDVDPEEREHFEKLKSALS